MEGRYEPSFYSPEFRLQQKGKFVRLKDLTIKIVHPPEYPREFSETGAQLIRSQNVRPTGISIDENPVYFSNEFLSKRRVIKPNIGDVLVVRSGVNAGDTSVIEHDLNNAIIGADTLLCVCKKEVLPKFLQVYFWTSLGKNQMVRYVTGATNRHLNSENLRNVLVPNVDLEIQKHIVTIFESAYTQKQQKEAEAKELLASIDTYLLNELGIVLPEKEESLDSRIFEVMYSEISSDRHDPFFYTKYFINIEKSLLAGEYKIIRLSNLCKLQNGYAFKSSDYIEYSDTLNARMSNIRPNNEFDINYNPKYLPNEFAKTYKSFILKDGDIIIAMTDMASDPKILGVPTVISNAKDKTLLLNQRVGKLFDFKKEIVNMEYLKEILSSKLIKEYYNKMGARGVQINISAEQILSAKIPLPPMDKQKEIAEHILSIRKQAQQLQTVALEILAAAKEEVERMILG